MNLAVALRFPQSKTHDLRTKIAFVGAGGKTTAMFALARHLVETPRRGVSTESVLVTTTTHFATWQVIQADHHFVLEGPGDVTTLEGQLPTGVILFTAEAAGDGRVLGVDPTTLEEIRLLADRHRLPLLIEADGSRMHPVKAPAEHEPAIPSFVDTVVVVAGLSALGKPLDADWVHRPERFAGLSGLAPGAGITASALANVLCHPAGGLKNIPPAARRIALLNQADLPELQAAGQDMSRLLLPTFHAVIVASLQAPRNAAPPGIARNQEISDSVYAVHEQIAGIVLAAGESHRLGQPKQLLEWAGEAFVRRVARTALEAGLSPVVVVTGAHAAEVEAVLVGLSVRIANNSVWQAGQSTSLQAGLHLLLPPILAQSSSIRSWSDREREWGDGRNGVALRGVGGAIFLLADQPQLPLTLLRSLVETHAHTLAPIVAPLVSGQRGNPVLFDQATFPDLMALTGDVGGRALFSRYPVTWLPWDDAGILLDVDTAEDYQRLLDQ